MQTPKGMFVDHIDGNGQNNSEENMEHVTQMENVARGKQGISVTGLRGVSPLRNPHYPTVFQVRANIDGKSTYLGIRPTRIEASRLHDETVEKIDGNGSRSNRAHPRNKELYDRLTEEERQGVADVSF
jgi:hypothetical protein